MKKQLLAFLAAVWLLTACAPQSLIKPAKEDSTWAEQVNRTWHPRILAAIAQFNAFAKEQQLPPLKHAPSFELLTVKAEESEAPDEPKKRLLRLTSDSSTSDLYEYSVRTTLQALFKQQQHELAEGKEAFAPEWLEDGAAVYLAEKVQARLQTKESELFTSRTLREILLRSLKDTPDIEAVFTPEAGWQYERGVRYAWLLEQLEQEVGAGFLKAWQRYFRQAALPGFSHDKAFTTNFGLSPQEFRLRSKQRLLALQAQLRQHETSPPAESGFAKIDDLQALPFAHRESSVDSYSRFLKARAPKAFYFTSLGTSFVSDSSNAISYAQKLCEMDDPLNCRLYAVDDKVVFSPPDPASIRVHVKMAGSPKDPRFASAEKKWRPVVQKTADFFLTELKEQTGRTLINHSIIHIACNQDDFLSTLKHQLDTSQEAARQFSQHSSGVANGRGGIVVFLRDDVEEEAMEANIASIVLHEMVHEFQGQLSGGDEQFAPSPWLTEGSAEVLAMRMAAKLPGKTGKTFDPAERESWLKQMYKLETMPDPAEVFAADAARWRDFSNQDKRHYASAELMTHYLTRRLQDRFASALTKYFSLAGQKDQTEEAAFQESFGLEKQAFISAYQEWLKRL